MKVKITFIQDGNNNITISDEILEPMSTFSEKLSSILKKDNVVAVEFPNTILILRPSKILSIKVDYNQNEEDCIVED